MNKNLAKRYAAERRFKFYGLCSVLVGLIFLIALIGTIFKTGYSAFIASKILVNLNLEEYSGISSMDIPQDSLEQKISEGVLSLLGVELRSSELRKTVKFLLSQKNCAELREFISNNPRTLKSNTQVWLTSSSTFDQLYKGNIDIQNPAQINSIGEKNLDIFKEIVDNKKVKTFFNWRFVTSGDSRYPELAGIAGAVLGSLYTLVVCLLVSFPIAVAAAIYLEEFAKKNRFTSFIEININNLAAVPSIIYGLLGLVVILGFFGVPRSTPLAGGIVLALRTLPTIIIACRASIRSVPPSIRQAALAMGASPVQVVLHQVLPLSLPGTLTGAIIGLSQALGETAPLLLIGMVAFVVDLPHTPLDPSTSLPVQIYLWAESSERGYVEKTSAAIMVILSFLLVMNSVAVIMRKKYERRW